MIPNLIYFTLEGRRKGHALIAKMCQAVGCAHHFGYLTARGYEMAGKHKKDDVHPGLLTSNDLRLMADLADELAEKERLELESGDTISGEGERAA